MIQDVVWTLLTVAEHYSVHHSLYMNQLELEPQLDILHIFIWKKYTNKFKCRYKGRVKSA